MNYILLWALLVVLLFILLLYRHFKLKSNYIKHLEIEASLLLGMDQAQKKRVNGSMIFELKRYSDQLRDIRIKTVQGVDEGTLVRDFGILYFDLDRECTQRGNLCSVGVTMSRSALHRYRNKKGYIYIAGVLTFPKRKEKRFAAKLLLPLRDRTETAD